MDIDFRATGVLVLATFAVVAALERLPRFRLLDSPFWRPFFATDVGWYAVASGITLAFAPELRQLAEGRVGSGLPGLESLGIPWAAEVVLATVLYDLGATVSHMLLHRFEPLWRLHKVHHSSPVLDWLATVRAHGLEHLVRGVPTQAVLLLAGVSPSGVAAALAIYAAFATLGHSNLKLDLARLEWLFVTPRIHRLHHVPQTTHRNFGTVFTLWDRALGRLVIGEARAGEPLGVPGEIGRYPQSWWGQLIEPFQR